MPLQIKTSEPTGNGCNWHAVPSETQFRDNYIVQSDVNPFVHRQLLFTTMDKIRVRMSFLIRKADRPI